MGTGVITLPSNTRHVRRAISDCEWKLLTFLQRDAFAPYDYEQALKPPQDDRLQVRHRVAMNAAMRARSSSAAWDQFLDCPLPELASVPRDLCLIRGVDKDVEPAIRAAAMAVSRIGAVRGLTDMAASKMLYLLRPKFIAIHDSCGRSA